MEFTTHYSELQQKQARIINNEIDLFNVPVGEYCNGWPLEQVHKVLAGESPINPKKVLDSIWALFFGDFSPEQFMPDASISATYNEDDLTILARIKKRIKEKELEGQEIKSSTLAARMKKTPGMVSQLLSGKYAASPTKYLHEVWSIVEPANVEVATETESTQSSIDHIRIRYGEVPFVPISTISLVKNACGHALERRRIAVLSGQAGIGKSTAAKHYRDTHEGVVYLEGDESTSATHILQELAYEIGVSTAGTNKLLQKKIIGALNGANRLIILDEADKCKPNALDPLRTISDRAMVGIVLIGNLELSDELSNVTRYNLIHSRACFTPPGIGELTVKDIKSLFLTLTENKVKVADNSETWWKWLHKRVEGNARMLTENVLPHVLSSVRNNPGKKVDKLMLNAICASILNKPTL